MSPAPEERPQTGDDPEPTTQPALAPAAGPVPDPDAPPGKRKGIGQGKGPRAKRLVRHSSIDDQLAPADLSDYEALLLDPRQTCDSLLAWLHGRGYTKISRGAVHRHRRRFEQDVLEIRKSARIAGQFATLARAQGGAGSLADAGQFRFEQMFLQRLFDMGKDERMDGKQWAEFGKAMSALLDNRRKYETLRLEWQEKAMRAADAVEDAAGAGGKAKPNVVNGVAIANTVRRILGVPLPGEAERPPERGAQDGRRTLPGPSNADEARGIEIADEVRRNLGLPPVSEN